MNEQEDIKRIDLETVKSTNDFLHQYADEVPHRITLATARYQTAGRGATGGWESEPDQNLLFSLLTHPASVPPSQMFVLSEAIALSVCDALNSFCEGFQIKWPNDIYFKNDKVVGMLIENDLRGRQILNCVMGVGVNVNQTRFLSDAPNPSSLALIMGQEQNRELVLQAILQRFSGYLGRVEQGEYQLIHQAFVDRLYRKGEEHGYADEQGSFRAVLQDVEPSGHLVLQDSEGHVRRYAFKEVKFLI